MHHASIDWKFQIRYDSYGYRRFYAYGIWHKHELSKSIEARVCGIDRIRGSSCDSYALLRLFAKAIKEKKNSGYLYIKLSCFSFSIKMCYSILNMIFQFVHLIFFVFHCIYKYRFFVFFTY